MVASAARRAFPARARLVLLTASVALAASCRIGVAEVPAPVRVPVEDGAVADARSLADAPTDAFDSDAARDGSSDDASVDVLSGYPGFVRGATNEAVEIVSDDDGRRYTNVPLPFDPTSHERPREVLVYATPNGNTLEQTLGRARHEDESFRYDIQHVLAQTRLYRRLVPERDVILVVLEAPGLAWPQWVRSHADAPARAVAELARVAPMAPDAPLVLASHSGGGSFAFAVIDGYKKLPQRLERLIFLDSDYAFEEKSGHAAKLAEWLSSDKRHVLSVIAYDDRNIRLHGRRVVSKKGGSYRATERMLKALGARKIAFVRDTVGPFVRTRGKDGRVDVRVHPNPKNVILHSALVSDENGLVSSLGLLRGADVERAARFGRPRIFGAYVDPAPPVELVADSGPTEAGALDGGAGASDAARRIEHEDDPAAVP